MNALDQIRAARAADTGNDRKSLLDQVRAARRADGGYSTAADRIAAAKAGTLEASPAALDRAAKADQVAEDEMVIASTPGGVAGGAVAKATQGLPFVGEYVDEAFNAINPGQGDRLRALQGAMDRQHPKTAIASEIAGGVVGSIPLVAGGASVAAKGGGIVQKAAIGGGLGAVGGGTEGAISGYGAGTDKESRLAEASKRGLMGGGLGGLLGFAAPLFGAGAKAVVRRVKRLDVATIADEFSVDRKTANVIKSYLVNDDLDAAARRLSAIGDDAMLADAGLGTGQALDTAMASGGKALRIGREAVEARSSAAGKRLSDTMDDVLGAPAGIKAAARDISQRTAGVRSKAYDFAYRQPIDYASDAGRGIEAVLARVPGRTLRSAVQEANDAMQARGLRNMQIMAEIADDGSVVFREMPNVRQLDQLKRALGDIAATQVDDFGRPTAEGLRNSGLAEQLRDAIKGAVPAYSRALKLGGDKIAEDNALRIGKGLLTRNAKVEDVRAAMVGASAEAKIAAKRGLREGIEETLSNVRRTITDPNTDAREAMQLVKDMSSRANKAKLRFVLGQSETDRLMNELDRTAAALELRAMVATNSKTAVRQAGQEAVGQATERGAIGSVMSGNPQVAAQKAIQALTGATDAATVARREEIFAQIAQALTEKRGAEAQRALVAVKRAMQGQPIRDAEAQAIVRAVGVPLVSGLHQSAMQALEGR